MVGSGASRLGRWGEQVGGEGAGGRGWWRGLMGLMVAGIDGDGGGGADGDGGGGADGWGRRKYDKGRGQEGLEDTGL